MIQFFWKLYLRILNPSCSIRAHAVARNVKMEKGVTLEHGSVICADHIGKYTFINKYSLVDKGTRSIGRFCSIAYGVKIGLGEHPTDWVSTHPFAYQEKYGFVKKSKSFNDKTNVTVIGNDVWIGANAIILAGVTIGDGAIIGAGSLVNEDVEPYSVVVGTPAKRIKYRFEEEKIKKLLASKWWEWEDDKIRENIDCFDDRLGILRQ